MKARERGSNGADPRCLAGEFYKCPTCSIKIPTADIEDYRATQRCPFGRAGCPFTTSEELTLPDREKELQQAEKKCRRPKKNATGEQQLWVAIETPEGNVYYHNTQNGDDVWQKPADFGKTYKGGRGFVPFGDRTKDILVAEQTRRDAARMGIKIPEPVVPKSQFQLMEEQMKNMAAKDSGDTASANETREKAKLKQYYGSGGDVAQKKAAAAANTTAEEEMPELDESDGESLSDESPRRCSVS